MEEVHTFYGKSHILNGVSLSVREGEIVIDQLPRRSGKEAFFPLCEDIMSYEKEGQKVTVTDIDPARFPETVLHADVKVGEDTIRLDKVDPNDFLSNIESWVRVG